VRHFRRYQGMPGFVDAVFFFLVVRIIDFRSTPIITLSLATRSRIATRTYDCDGRIRAASFTRLAKSAQRNLVCAEPARKAEHRPTTESCGCGRQDFFLPRTSAIPRPPAGQNVPAARARIQNVGRFVAAIRITPSFDSKPSHLDQQLIQVCSRSSCRRPSCPRDGHSIDFIVK